VIKDPSKRPKTINPMTLDSERRHAMKANVNGIVQNLQIREEALATNNNG